MGSPALRTLTSISLACVAVLGVAACDPKTRTATPVHCEVLADPPADTDGHIAASVRYWCDDPGADRVTLTVTLQKENSAGHWVAVGHRTFTQKGHQTVRTDDERYHTGTVTAGCATGTFRTVVTGSSVSHSKTTTYSVTGSGHVDPCS